MTVATPRVLVVSESRITRRVVEMTFADRAVAARGVRGRARCHRRLADAAAGSADRRHRHGRARRLRRWRASCAATPPAPRRPVLLLAGQSDVIDEPAVVEARVSAVLRKPLDSHQLVDAVRQALRAGPPPAAAPDRRTGRRRPADSGAGRPPCRRRPPVATCRVTADDGLADVFHALLDVEQGDPPRHWRLRAGERR